MTKIVLICNIKDGLTSIEDSGKAYIIEPHCTPVSHCDENFFIRFHSYDESIKRKSDVNSSHHTIRSLNGKKVKITIEEIE